MENKVIAKEYVEKNYISKKKIEEKIDFFKEMGKDIHEHYYYENEIEVLEGLLEDK